METPWQDFFKKLFFALKQITHFFFKPTDRSAIAHHPIPTPTPSREFRSSMMKFFSRHTVSPLTIYHTTPNIDIKFRILFFSVHIALAVALVYQPKNITEISRHFIFNNNQ